MFDLVKADSERGRSKGFRLLAGISLYWVSLSFLTDGLTTLVLPHDLERLAPGSRATWLGLLTFLGLVLAMLVQPIAGQFSDRTRERWGRRGTIAVGLGLALLSMALYSAGDLVALSAGYVLTLVFASVSQAGQQGFIPDLIPEGRRGLASGLKGFADLAGAACGFLVLGGMLGSEGSRQSVAVIGAVLVAGYLATRLLVSEPAMAAPRSTVSLVRANPFRVDLHRHRGFAWLVAARFFFLAGSYAVARFFLFFVGDRLDLDPARASERAGSLLAGLTLITLLAAPLAGEAADRIPRPKLMQLGAALTALGALLLIPASTAGQILFFGGVMAIGNAAFTAANWAMTADVVPADEAGRFMGVANLGTMGAAAFPGLFGPLVDALNRGRPGGGYTLLFMVAVLASVSALFASRRIAAIVNSSDTTGRRW